MLAGTNDARAERGWRQVEQSLTTMKTLCDARRATLAVAILPRRDQVAEHPRAPSVQRARPGHSTRRGGIEALDLLPQLAAAYRRAGDGLFIPWDGHNSAAANQVIAAGLASLVTSMTSTSETPRSGRGR